MTVTWVSLRDRQSSVLDSVLALAQERWKVLVVDERGAEVVRELRRGVQLRQVGVTACVTLGKIAGEEIDDAVGVYFVAPTEASALKVAEDARNEVFERMYICFLADPAPLNVLASAVMAAPPPKALRLSKVMSARADFVCIEPSFFHLGTNAALSDPSLAAHGLLCVLSTLGAVPVILAQKGTRAELVAEILADRLRAEIHASKMIQSSLVSVSERGLRAIEEDATDCILGTTSTFLLTAFSGFTPVSFRFSLSNTCQRPMLILADRERDITSTLRHPWTYRALLHDVLGLQSAKIVVTVRDGSTEKKVEYELGQVDDTFWRTYATSSFPEVAAALEQELAAYLNEVAEVNKLGVDTAGVVASLPDLARRKELIDMHMNIATALLEQIESRSLDGLFQVEEDAQSGAVDRNSLLSVLQSPKGTVNDKLRAFLVCYLSGPAMTKADLDQYLAALTAAGCPLDAAHYAMSLRDTTNKKPASEAAMQRDKGRLGLVVSGLVHKGKTGLKKGLKDVAQNINKLMTLSGGRAMALARITNALMEQRGSSVENGFTHIDPKLRYGMDNSPTGTKRPFSRALVFVIGGGNYLEYENLLEHTEGKNVVYGTSRLLTGDAYLECLASEEKAA